MLKIKLAKNSAILKSFIALSIFLNISFAIYFFLVQKNKLKLKKHASQLANTIIRPASAEEIYPMFICPCCGKTINTKCCGMAKERQIYIEGLTQGKLSKEETIAVYVKKYGLDSFKNKSQKKEFKKKLIAKAPNKRPIISLNLEKIDLGDVSQAKGEISTLFEITNTGKSNLIINKLNTSCGCTSAAIVYNGQEGPRFTMAGHKSENPTNWQVVIPAGKKAQLKVYYDPNVHKKFRGPVTREIYIFSNDPVNFETKVKIDLNQTD